MPSDFNRKDRFNRMLKEELSRLLVKEVRDPRLGHVRITDVETTGDLRHAKIFYRIEELTATLHEDVQKGLQRATPFLRGRLGRDLHIRFAPTLTFEQDETLEYGSHIEALLDQIQTGASNHDDDSD